MLQLSGDYLFICLLVNHIFSLFNMYQNISNLWRLPLNLVGARREGGQCKGGMKLYGNWIFSLARRKDRRHWAIQTHVRKCYNDPRPRIKSAKSNESLCLWSSYSWQNVLRHLVWYQKSMLREAIVKNIARVRNCPDITILNSHFIHGHIKVLVFIWVSVMG